MLVKPESKQMNGKLKELLIQPPQCNINIFKLNLENQILDKTLIDRATVIITKLRPEYRLILNAVFWDYARLMAFVTAPSSLVGHHAEVNGNLRHSIEVAEQVMQYSVTRPDINIDLAVLTALLHDAGKAEEYESRHDGTYKLSLRGRLLGHKFTSAEWVIEAVAKYNLTLPGNDYLLLLHNLSAVANAPFWMGLRNPATLEARFLSFSDQVSGIDDLAKQTTRGQRGWGAYHEHLPAKQIYFS